MKHPPAHPLPLKVKNHHQLRVNHFARNVVRNYMERYIPAALALAREMRDGTDGARFLWTTGSWLIYEYLEQADAAGRRAMEEGILAGDIAWHALPFTTHTELMDESLFRFGLSLSGELDARFGRKTIAAKMTDVPGHTIGMVPLLAEAGVRFLHIGVNPACRPPQVPDVFRWRHPGGDEVVVMYHKGSYGSTMRVPGMTDAIAFAHTGDNCGPQSAEQIRIAFAHLRADFPGAEVAASTLDAYARALLEIADTLPVVDQEIGDTWIHGVGTDPRKVVLFRQLSRLRRHLLDEGTYTGEEADFKAFSRALLMIPEHTWGLDEKTYLGDYVNYSRPDFEAARKKDVVTAPIPPESPAWGKFRKKDPKPRYSYFESSWHEQRRYLVDAMDALPATLSEVLDEAVAAVLPAPVDRTGFAPASPGYRAVTNFFIRFDAATGALNLLNDKRNDVTWADKRHPWGLVRYQTFSQADYDRYLAQYTINMEHTWVSDWAVPDLSKPGMAATGAESRMWLPALQEFLWRRAPEADDFLAVLAMPEEAVTRYGAPATVEVLYRFPHDAPAVLVEVHWSDKAANRLPEALWCTFHPVAPIADGWVLDKMGTAVNPRDVVRYGNRRLHSVDNDVRYRDSLGGIDLFTPDAPLVAPGAPGLLDFAQTQPDPKHGMHVNLYNNVWGTNFPMWHDEDALFRFLVVVAAAEDA